MNSSFILWLGLLVAACGAAPTDPVDHPTDAPPGAPPGTAATPTDPRAGDWPGFLGPYRDGRSPEALDISVWSGPAPPILWEHPVGEGYGGPAVVEDHLYFFDRHGDQARLVNLDAATGREIWRSEYTTDYVDAFDFSGGPRATPVVDEDRVYTFGVEGRLRCHATNDGKLLWEVDTAQEYGVVQNFFGVGATPWVEGNLLLVPVGGSPPGSPSMNSGAVQGNGSGVVAFDRKTGAERYRISDELVGYASPVVATIGPRRWAFVFARGGLLAFEPQSGKIDFHFPYRARKLYSVNAATPVVVGDLVFLTESYEKGGTLLKVTADGPRIVWQDPRRGQALASHWSTPIHHQGTLYGSHGEASGSAELRAVDLATGKVHWGQRGLGRTTQIYTDGHLIVLGERGLLVLVEATPDAYREVARLDLGERLGHNAWNPPALAHGRLYLRGSKALLAMGVAPPTPKDPTDE